jgi:hypothetical protein
MTDDSDDVYEVYRDAMFVMEAATEHWHAVRYSGELVEGEPQSETAEQAAARSRMDETWDAFLEARRAYVGA